MDQEELIYVSKHETLHALLLMKVGSIDWVSVTWGETQVRLWLQPSALIKVYRENPSRVYDNVNLTLVGCLAPSLVQGAALDGADLELIREFEEGWYKLAQVEPVISWKHMLSTAHDDVRLWYRSPGMRDHVGRVAKALADRRMTYGDKMWRRLVKSCAPPPPPAPTRAGIPSAKEIREQFERKMEILYPWQRYLERYCARQNAPR
jgi:hypothetical protein